MNAYDRLPTDGFESLGSGMTSVLSPIFTLSAISVLGIGNFTLEGISLTQTILGPWNGISISLGSLLAFSTVILAYLANDNDFSDFTDQQSWVAYATAGSVVVLSVAPTLRNAIAGSQAASWIVFGAQVIGFGLIAGIRGDH